MELKFRAWHKENSEMVYFNADKMSCDTYIAGHFIGLMGRGLLMQCTGLTDKNGVDIYDGDLMKNKSGRICKVVWHKYAACWDADVVVGVGDSLGGYAQEWRFHMEVIGSIHQHPELMESNCD